MPSDSVRTALETLGRLGWSVRVTDTARPLPASIENRYKAIPASLRSFIEHIDECALRDQVWFLASQDYAADSETGFAWNAWELLELKETPDAEAEIRAFWDAHLPILLSVGGDYSYLAVCVDRTSANYGAVVEGYSPEFRELSTLCESFDALLEEIKNLEHGSLEGDLAPWFMHPHDARWLKSQQAGARSHQRPFDRLMERVRSWRMFETYRVGVVVERKVSRPLWAWENWSKIMPPLTAVISGIKAEAVIHPRQAGDHDNWLRFGRLPWNEKNNRTWTTKYLADPTLEGKATFVATEIWAPSRAISFEKRRGPELFCMLDRNEPADTQGFVLAIRKDVLSRVDIAADETIFSVRELFEASDCIMFDRSWGELGRFGATVVISGLDWTGSTAVLHWAKQHKKHHVRSFRWRRWMG